MPKRKIVFKTGQPYHIFSRAVEEIKIFQGEPDCYRFIFQAQVANGGESKPHLSQKKIIKAAKALLLGGDVPSEAIIVQRSPLVYILSFALVKNHFHFKLVPNVENGISKYMQRLNNGFARYFNLKHDRRGILFDRRYQAIPIETDFQMAAVKRYINVLNPLDVCQPGWRKQGLRDWKQAFECIKNYQFSSLPDLLGLRNSKILAPKEVLEQYYGKQLAEDQAEYAKFVEDYLRENLIDLYPLFLE